MSVNDINFETLVGNLTAEKTREGVSVLYSNLTESHKISFLSEILEDEIERGEILAAIEDMEE